MFTSDFLANKPVEISVQTVTSINGPSTEPKQWPRLEIKDGDNTVGLTLSREQLELMLDAAEWWLLKQDESAGLMLAGELRETA